MSPPQTILLSFLFFSLLLLLLTHPSSSTRTPTHLQTLTTTTVNLAADHCNNSLYPDLCMSTLSTIPQLTTKTLPEIICSAINFTALAVESSATRCASYLHSRLASLDPRLRIALSDCLELFDQTMSDLHKAVSDLEKHPTSQQDDLKTVLSAAITNQYSCLDGFAFVEGSHNLRPLIEGKLFNISHLISNSLAMSA